MNKAIILISLLLLVNTAYAAKVLTYCEGIKESGDYIVKGDILHNRHIGSCFKIYTDNVTIDCQNAKLIGDIKTAFEIINSDNVLVQNCHASGFTFGARVYFSENVTFRNNDFANNTNGIMLFLSDFNSIENNLISQCGGFGLQMSYSNSNSISGNTFTRNLEAVNIAKSDKNVFFNNVLANNQLAFNIQSSNQNKIKANFFCQNSYNFRESTNIINEFSSNVFSNDCQTAPTTTTTTTSTTTTVTQSTSTSSTRTTSTTVQSSLCQARCQDWYGKNWACRSKCLGGERYAGLVDCPSGQRCCCV